MWSEDDRLDQQRVPQESLKENYRQGEGVLTTEDRNASHRADSKDKYRTLLQKKYSIFYYSSH